MPEVVIRKRVTVVEEILHEGGPPRHCLCCARRGMVVIRNPFAGRYVEDIAGFMDDLKPLGVAMAKGLLQALGGGPSRIEGYGKGAIVGRPANRSMARCGMCRAATPCARFSAEAKASCRRRRKVGGPGSRLDVPVTHINASYVRSHFDAMEIGINDAPRADEMLLALVMTTGARVHARVGGLKASEIKGQDGLR